MGPAAAAAEPFLSDVAVTAAAPWAYSGPVLLTDPAPSGINMLPGWEQQLWFVASMSIVLLGTVAIKQLVWHRSCLRESRRPLKTSPA